jgi:hypothetical protein
MTKMSKKAKNKMRNAKIEYELIEYADGEKLLGEAYNSGRDYISCGPLGWTLKICSPLPGVTIVVDNGTELIGVFTGPGSDVSMALYTMAAVVPCAWVALIPRSTDPKLIEEIGLHQAQLENKYVIMASKDEKLFWPRMLVNGIDLFDPISAAGLRAQSTVWF